MKSIYKAFVTFSLSLLFFNSFSQINLSAPVGKISGSASVNSVGMSTYSIPIELPDGINDLTPGISLTYNATGSSNVLGIGWNLNGSSVISRSGKTVFSNGLSTPVGFNKEDRFNLDGNQLFPISGDNGNNGTIYGTESENFSKIESFGYSSNGPDWFKVTLKNGNILEYGRDELARYYTNDRSSIMMWFLNRVEDKNGNYIKYHYHYNQSDRNYALIQIDYAGNNNGTLPQYKILLNYAVKSEWNRSPSYIHGNTYYFPFNLSNIRIVNSSGALIHQYSFNYEYFKDEYYLKSIYKEASDGSKLNPTLFTYGSNVTANDVALSLNYSGFSPETNIADYDGDGKDDIQAIRYRVDNNGQRIYTSYDILSDFSSYNGWPSVDYFYNYELPQTQFVKIYGDAIVGGMGSLTRISSPDMNGDGKTDVVMFKADNHFRHSRSLGIRSYTPKNSKPTTEKPSDIVPIPDFKGVDINYSKNKSFFGGTYPGYKTVSYNQTPTSAFGTHNTIYRNGSYFTIGDFDGDGNQDYILILRTASTLGTYKAFLSSPAKNIFNQEIGNFGVGSTGAGSPFYATSVASASMIYPIKFDGSNSSSELLVIKDEGAYVLSIYPVPATSGFSFAAKVLSFTSHLKSDYLIYPGDFNGDGNTDILYRESNDNAYSSWYYLISTGKEWQRYSFVVQNRIYQPGDNGGSTHHLAVGDYNGDGKSDIWHSLDEYQNGQIVSKNIYYYSVGTSFKHEIYYGNRSTNGLVNMSTITGDINGDGKPDILSLNGNNGRDGLFIYPKPFKETKLLKTVRDGFGAESTFNYALLNSKDPSQFGNVYDISSNFLADDNQDFKPFSIRKFPHYIVSHTSTDNGIGGQFIQIYKYQNAVFHPTGRGFLGFQKISSFDMSTAKGSSSLSSINTDYSMLVPYEQTVFVASDTISKTISNITFKRISANYFDKRFIQLVNHVTSKDFLKNTTQLTTYQYDNFGNATSEGTDFGNNIVKSVSRTFTNNTTGNYVIGLPQTETVISSRNGNNWTTSTEITYSTDGKYQPLTVLDKTNNAIVKETQFTYDVYGNVLKRQSAMFNSGTFLSTTNEYDATGRFVTKETDAFGYWKAYSNFNIFGQPTTVTDYKGNITSLSYDNWGRKIQVNNPDGTTDYVSVSWANNTPTGALIVVTESGTNKPTKKTYSDALGREVRASVTRFNGAELNVDKEYDYKGRLARVSLPSAGTPSLWSTYQYDQYDRPTSITAANGNTVTYSYNGNSVTETKNKVATTKNMDGAGNVVSITDPGGTINYTLRPDGQPTSVTAPGGIVTSFEYDTYGRRTKIIDPSAGTKTFGYDQWGNTNMETDANGKVTNITYDQYGRVTNKTTPELSTTYSYNADGLIETEVSSNATRKDMSYDNLGRITTHKETGVDGKWLQKTLAYNQGTVSTVAYNAQSGYITTETNAYQNGYLKTITVDGGTAIFDLQEENSQGKPTRVVSGAVTRNYSYDAYGMPTGRSAQSAAAGVYMNQQYEFDPLTGNLNYRKDATRNITDDYQYDELNRLTHVSGEPIVTYDYKGNIIHKDEMFTFNSLYYHYNNTAKPYAVTGIEQTASIIPQRQQQITYASFSRPLTITENGITAQFTYEAGGDRVKMSVTNNGALVINKYYLGYQYELDEKPGQTREKLYLGGDYYSAGAVLVRDNGGTWQLFYINSDYLGSITHIVNAAGNVVAEYNYDPWGRRISNPHAYILYDIGSEPELFLGRGYTGHEHLPWFGLINMNARLYDPVHGRFLAPDPYVQAPDMTQNFNRYAYALNNPLVYVDPDGNIIFSLLASIFAPPLIPLAMSMDVGWMSGGAMSEWRQPGSFMKGAIQGVISGIIGYGVGSALGGAFSNWGMVGGGMARGAIAGAITGGIGAGMNNQNILKGMLTGGAFGGLSGGLFGLAERLSLKTHDLSINYEGINYDGSKFANEQQLKSYINNNIGNTNDIEVSLKTKFSLASKKNLPANNYELHNDLLYRVKIDKRGKSFNLIGGATKYEHGFFSGLKSKIFISPGLKGLSSNGVSITHMSISHEIIHAFHYSMPIPPLSRSESVASSYSYEYSLFYKLHPALISSFKLQAGHYPSYLDWKPLTKFLYFGIR